ncbi:MAG: phosphatase PAP2 family protein [Oscillospiraceae bacterium]|nr:phosphatase PAP2 family protein [Oscillospiraceae bacterium]
MKKSRQYLTRLLPAYAWLPALSVIGMNFLVYYIPKLLETHRSLNLVSTALDDALPRVPYFAVIYVLAYAQWAVGILAICRESRAHCFRVMSGVLISEALVLLVFLVYPTTLRRPPVEVRDLPTAVLDWVYRSDTPTNLFPSLHCMQSWLCFRGAVGMRRTPRWYPWAQLIFALLVFASVILTKQHIWPDILGGIAFGELGQLLGRRIRAERLFGRLEATSKE